jgi:DNA polymerase III subunit beta
MSCTLFTSNRSLGKIGLNEVCFMKLQFNRVALAEALGMITAVVPSRTPKPILRCVRLTACERDVHMFATDLEVGLNILISEVQVERPGDAVLDADRLAAIVRESSDDILTLELSEETCHITGNDSRFMIYSQDPQQYPNKVEFEGDPDIQMDLGDLQAATKQVLFATAKESSRYAINGVLWEIKGKKLSLIATDGRRLARSRLNLAATPNPEIVKQRMIVPAKTMGLLERIGLDDGEQVSVKLTGNTFVMRSMRVVISSNLVEGSFPKYEDIIPADYDKKLTLNTETVLSAVRRASLLASEESKGIKISISPGSILFSGKAPEAGAAEINMGTQYKGDSISIGFNPQFLTEALRVIQSPEFDLELGQPDRPGLIKSTPDFLYVLMPINLA